MIQNQNTRDFSLDALRGYAIFTMILSGRISFAKVMPNWMFHAQVPPPLHIFDKTIPGITWVDLVFPFFLFCMGVSIPMALKNIKSNAEFWHKILERFLLLSFFAVFYEQILPYNINNSWLGLGIGIVAMVIFHFTMGNIFFNFNKTLFSLQKLFFVAIGMIIISFFIIHKNKMYFIPEKIDIIIQVLANMAFFGSIIWWFTKQNQLLRLVVLIVIGFIWIAGQIKGNIFNGVYNFSPFPPPFYKFYYLKYLFIIIPATFVGEWMMLDNYKSTTKDGKILASIFIILVVLNVYFLFTRKIIENFIFTISLFSLIIFVTKSLKSYSQSFKNIFFTASFLLLIGLVSDTIEGGIKKDPSNFSYYFTTTGLACFSLLFFKILFEYKTSAFILRPLALFGKNPLLAYVMAGLVIAPFWDASGISNSNFWFHLNDNFLLGTLKGFIISIIVFVITFVASKKKYFWKA